MQLTVMAGAFQKVPKCRRHIPPERLASIACMSTSKLKTCFKRQVYPGAAISRAEHLLFDIDFTMGQIAQMIGYSISRRFAELFKNNTGILPIK